MSNNESFSGDGKKGEEELLDFDFEVSSGEGLGNEGGDFSSDEEILELVDIVEPAADIDDAESDEIAKLMEDEPDEEPEEKVLDLDVEGLDQPGEEDTSQILESDISSVLDELEGGADEGEKLFEDTEADEIAKLLGEEPDGEPKENVLDLDLEGLDQSGEEDTSQILESDVGSVLDELDSSKGGIDEGEKLFEDTEADEIAELFKEEPAEEGVGVEEEEELDLEELEEIAEEDETQAFEADFDTTVSSIEPVEELDTGLPLDETELESVYDDEALGVSKIEAQEPAGFEEAHVVLTDDEDTSGLDEETPTQIPYEDLSGVSETAEEALEDDMLYHAGQEIPGISEERIEAIIREVVEDVVERVAKETMATVAEKVIRSAIDALKESIESTRD